MSGSLETSDGFRRLRRPSDLRKEGTPHRARARMPDQPALSWPERFVDSEGDRSALIVLLHLASLTPRRLLDLAQERRAAASCLDAVAHGAGASDSDQTLAGAIRPDEVKSLLQELGARFVAVGDPEYPPELLDLFDPPAGLFVRGRPLGALVPRVAMVGARNCSPSGREVATALARALAHAGVCVVSGGARGIDAAAHRGALRAEGQTISVMGCGIDILYPGQNRALLQEIAASGAVVSEYPPGTPAEPFRFPARNRIVAALSRAVVVVEGATGSGSMITADHALDVGRDVFAVPGAVSSPLAAVPLALIRDGATLVRGSRDLLGDLGLPVAVPEGLRAGEAEGLRGSGPRSLSASERAVWEALTAAMAPDSVAGKAGMPLPEVMSALVGLELRGKVRQIGGRYERRLEESP
jgi:DNA processing protein